MRKGRNNKSKIILCSNYMYRLLCYRYCRDERKSIQKRRDRNICSPAILHGESQPRINLTLLSFKYLSLEIPYPIKHQPHKITAPSHIPMMYFSSFPFPFYQLKHTAHNSENISFHSRFPWVHFFCTAHQFIYIYLS